MTITSPDTQRTANDQRNARIMANYLIDKMVEAKFNKKANTVTLTVEGKGTFPLIAYLLEQFGGAGLTEDKPQP